MPSRPYRSAVRKQAESETLRRIVAATVELHAQKGGMATTHAEIAARAGVSLPTVYKHFPNRDALIPACTGLVEAQAPALDPAAILAGADLDARLELLVQALHARYRFFHPWLRWGQADAPFLPSLKQNMRRGQQELEALARAVFTASLEQPLAPRQWALALVILDYSTWQRLSGTLPETEVSRAALHGLQRLLSPCEKASQHHG